MNGAVDEYLELVAAQFEARADALARFSVLSADGQADATSAEEPRAMLEATSAGVVPREAGSIGPRIDAATLQAVHRWQPGLKVRPRRRKPREG
jgi:hypothetical protein